MSVYGKLDTARKTEHVIERLPGHAADKAAGEERRAEQWLLLPAPAVEKTHRDFSAVASQMQLDYVPVGKELRSVSPAECLRHINNERRNTSYTGTKLRDGVPGTSKRRCKNPVNVITGTLSPGAADYLAVGVRQNPAKVAQIVDELVRKLWAEIEAITGARVVAVTVHLDTDTPHFNFVLSRITADQLTVADGFGLMGPWSVAVDRQRRIGIFWPAHVRKFVAGLKKHATRGRKGLPADIQIARMIDAQCAALLPGLSHFDAAYAADLVARRTDTIENQRRILRKALALLEDAQRIEEQPQQQMKGLTK
jgi:hypothetical protein